MPVERGDAGAEIRCQTTEREGIRAVPVDGIDIADTA
jgi:hypothetical protein